MISEVVIRHYTPTIANTVGVNDNGIPTINGKIVNLEEDTNIVNHNGRLVVFDGEMWTAAVEYEDYLPGLKLNAQNIIANTYRYAKSKTKGDTL